MTSDRPTLAGRFTRNPHLLIVSIALLLVAGLSALVTLPRIEDPRITTRNGTIVTAYPGASAERVEALVTKKLEDRLREIAEIKTIESTSRSGVSVIAIELQDAIGPGDNETVFAKVRDRLDDAEAELPAGAAAPIFDDKRGAVADSLILAVSWDASGAPPLGIVRRHAERLGDLLRGLPGSEQVMLYGAPQEEVQVEVDAAELAATGMTVADLAARIASADTRRSAGTLRGSALDLPLELAGPLDSAARIGAVPLIHDGDGGLLTVGDIARVTKGWADPPAQIALHDGRRSILVAVRTEQAIRLDRWAVSAREAVRGFVATLDSGIAVDTVFDQSRYTKQRLGDLAGNLVAGALLIVVVVWLMLGWRPALVVGSALPLAAGATLFGLTLFDEPIHQMGIFGMIIAIGLLIDNAIVITHSVVGRRRSGLDALAAVNGAVRHLQAPLFASTLTTILGFMPIFLLPGNVGDFVGPIAISVVLALVASFALSMSVIPALAGLLAYREADGPRHWWRDGLSSRGAASAYRGLLGRAVHQPRLTLLATVVLPLTGFVLATGLGMQFFPPAERDQLEIQVWMPPGSAIERTAARCAAIERILHTHDPQAVVTWVAGASSPPVYYNQLRDHDNDPTYARGVVRLTDSTAAKHLEGVLQTDLGEQLRDAQVVVRAFGQGPPVAAPVGLRLVGPDPDTLRRLGEQLRELLHRQPEVTHTRASVTGGEPKLWLEADPRAARLAGLSLDDVAIQFAAALEGAVGGRVLEDLEDLPVRIRYAREARDSIAAVAGLNLALPDGDWVPALALGEVVLRPALAAITRRNGERVNNISAYLRQGALPIEVTRSLQAAAGDGALTLPPGYRIEWAGDSAEQQRAIGQLLTYAPVLATLMISSLVLSFRSFALAGLIGFVAVLSVGLGLLSLWAGGYPLGFNPILGTAGLVGVAINGCIVILAAIRANPRARAGDRGAIVDETLGATGHIVATTLTTVGGFIPLLLFTGGDFWPPLAVVIAGGVGLSAILSLVLTPAAYRLLAHYTVGRGQAPDVRFSEG